MARKDIFRLLLIAALTLSIWAFLTVFVPVSPIENPCGKFSQGLSDQKLYEIAVENWLQAAPEKYSEVSEPDSFNPSSNRVSSTYEGENGVPEKSVTIFWDHKNKRRISIAYLTKCGEFLVFDPL